MVDSCFCTKDAPCRCCKPIPCRKFPPSATATAMTCKPTEIVTTTMHTLYATCSHILGVPTVYVLPLPVLDFCRKFNRNLLLSSACLPACREVQLPQYFSYGRRCGRVLCFRTVTISLHRNFVNRRGISGMNRSGWVQERWWSSDTVPFRRPG